jgi:hypothetical protein
MLDQTLEFDNMVQTVLALAKADALDDLAEVLSKSKVAIAYTEYDGWNGGSYSYALNVVVDVKTFIHFRHKITTLENELLSRFQFAVRHLENESIFKLTIVPTPINAAINLPDPHRPFTEAETKRKEYLIAYLNKASEDELIEEILLPLFRQLGFHRITMAGHKDKALEYGKDIWMKYTLPTQHILYFGIQAKKGKIDAAGVSKSGQANIAEIHNQVLMMLGHEIFDPEIGKKVLVDHAFIVAGGEITKAARNWLGGKLDASKRSQIMFMDRDDILNLFIVTNLPLPNTALPKIESKRSEIDDLPF